VFLAAAKVGGIWANNTYPAEFINNNLTIQTNVIHAAWKTGVKRLLFLGSSCIYPRQCPQPMKEEYLLTGPLEQTNESYAVAKIAGIKMCEAYNRQYGTQYLGVMPTNLYGPNDNFDLETSHVLPALIRKFHLAKLASQGDWQAIENDESIYGKIPEDFLANLVSISKAHGHESSVPGIYSVVPNGAPKVILWGTGSPRREFLYVDDLAEACVFLMNRIEDLFSKGFLPLPANASGNSVLHAPGSMLLINIGRGKDQSIRELAGLVAKSVGFDGGIEWDTFKPDGNPRKLLDISKLTDIAWEPKIFLQDGIKKTYDWYLQNSTE
jgi:GDP-L-fucose synthase